MSNVVIKTSKWKYSAVIPAMYSWNPGMSHL